MARLRMAVIGVGYLGKEHARILADLPDVELIGVVDVDSAQAQTVAQRCRTRAFPTHESLLSIVDAATIVVPTTHHYTIASEFIRRRIPVLIEKPLAANLGQANGLVGLANELGVLVQVGHIERFNPAFEELQRRPFQPRFVECERLGAFTGRSADTGVVLDLMIHDLDLLPTLVKAPVRSVDGLGVSLFGEPEDVANARLVFENGCVAHLSASRASPLASRRLRAWAPEGYASVDFKQRKLTLIQPSEALRRCALDSRRSPESAPSLKDPLFGHHLEMLTLDCSQGDQLTRELEHFVQCVQTRARPRVTAEDGRNAMALATRILASIRSHAWTGDLEGPLGPNQLPPPLGPLFQSDKGQAAA